MTPEQQRKHDEKERQRDLKKSAGRMRVMKA